MIDFRWNGTSSGRHAGKGRGCGAVEVLRRLRAWSFTRLDTVLGASKTGPLGAEAGRTSASTPLLGCSTPAAWMENYTASLFQMLMMPEHSYVSNQQSRD